MHSDKSFMISMNNTPYPVRFEADVLDEFKRDHADSIDWELRKLSDDYFGPHFFFDSENQLSLIAPLLRDALLQEDSITVAKYVLWLATRHPEISGIRISENTYEYVAEAVDTHLEPKKTLH